jgi:hypothetical protein
MTALGQTRTSADVCGTTASPPKADMPGSSSDVAEGPIASTVLYAAEAIVIVAAFHRVFGLNPFAAWFGFACGAGLFIAVIPGLAFIRKFAKSWQREPRMRGKPIPAWADM